MERCGFRPRQSGSVQPILGVVVASLLPFVFLFFHGIDGNHWPDLDKVLGRGDLLVIGLVVTVGGMAELVFSMSRLQARRVAWASYFLIASVLVIVGEAAWYADITVTLLVSQKVADPGSVTRGSLGLFVASFVCSGKCVKTAAGVR